jgi:hypothetical protein
MEEEIAKYNLRLPAELYRRISKKAEAEHRSINGQMVVMLEDWFIDRGGPISNDDLLRILRERVEQRVSPNPVFDRPRKPEDGEEECEE